MIELINIAFLLLLAWLLFRAQADSAIRLYFWPALLFKVVTGFVLGYVYANYLGQGDTWALFQAAEEVGDISFSSIDGFTAIFIKNDYSGIENFRYGWIPSAFMVKILAVLSFFTNSNYWLTSAYLSLFSFFGFWQLASVIDRSLSPSRSAALTILFFPSIVFWTSGVLKESLAIGALAWLLAIFVEVIFGKRLGYKRVFYFLLALVVLAILKYYLAAILLVSIVTVLISRKIFPKNWSWHAELIGVFSVFLLISGAVSLTHPNLWLSRFLSVIYDNYSSYLSISEADNVIVFDSLQPTWGSFLYYLPKAVWVGLYLPLWSNSFTIFKVLAIIENWFVLFLTVGALYKIRVPQTRDMRILVFTATLFVTISAVFIAFSTPNLGTLVRYKVGYMLILIPMLWMSAFRKHRKD